MGFVLQWLSVINRLRYRLMCRVLYQIDMFSDFASQLPSFTGESLNEVDDSAVRQCLGEKSDLQ